MSKVFTEKEVQEAHPTVTPVTDPRSVAELSAYFLRSESWVKSRKNDLKAIWFWCQEDLFDEVGSLTTVGFDRLQNLFDMTAVSRIQVAGGKRKSVPCKAAMSPAEYQNFIWAKHRKSPVDMGSEGGTNPVTDGSVTRQIEVIDAEFCGGIDTGSEIAESTAIQLFEMKEITRKNKLTLIEAVQAAATAQAEELFQVFTTTVQAKFSDAIATSAQTVLESISAPTETVIQKKSMKKATRS